MSGRHICWGPSGLFPVFGDLGIVRSTGRVFCRVIPQLVHVGCFSRDEAGMPCLCGRNPTE